jgi:hypothetical protein
MITLAAVTSDEWLVFLTPLAVAIAILMQRTQARLLRLERT